MDARQKLLKSLQQIVTEQLGARQDEITEHSTWEQLGADSLDRLEMTRVLEGAFKVEIPHTVGERLDTVGETVGHLLALMEAPRGPSRVRIEAVTTGRQRAEMSEIRKQVFTVECGFSCKPAPGSGESGVWHFLARDNGVAIGTLSIVDTTGDHDLHQRFGLMFGARERVARYAQLAILKSYRGRGIFELLIENAQSTIIRPGGFAVGWLLYPAARARSCRLTQSLGFTAEAPLLATEFGVCNVLMRREPGAPRLDRMDASFSLLNPISSDRLGQGPEAVFRSVRIESQPR